EDVSRAGDWRERRRQAAVRGEDQEEDAAEPAGVQPDQSPQRHGEKRAPESRGEGPASEQEREEPGEREQGRRDGAGGARREAAERGHGDDEPAPRRRRGEGGTLCRAARRREADQNADQYCIDCRGSDCADHVDHWAPPDVISEPALAHDAYTSYPTRADAPEIPGHGDSGPRGEARSVTGPDAGLEDLGDGHDLLQRRRQCHPGPWAHGLDESLLGALPDRERLL